MNKTLTVTRTFDAPVELVWKAWSDEEMIKRWWGPQYFTSPSCKLDFKVGGVTLVSMKAPDNYGGQLYYNTWSYTKIVPMELIEYITNLTDENGKVIEDPTSVGARPDFPRDVLTTVTFKAIGETTEVTVVESEFPEGQMFTFAELGLNQTLDKMALLFK